MRLKRCENGHFYDGDKYYECPHCEKTCVFSDELPEELKLFQTGDVLGKGKTSTVYRMEVKQRYAVKVIDISEPISEHMAENEYKIAKQLEGEKSFQKYYAMYKCGGKVYFVQPELRNLLDYIKQNNTTVVELISILEDVAQAIVILHHKNLMHLDIKPTNILVDNKGNVKLGDFSVSSRITEYQANPSCRGTPKYYAPEVFNRTGYSGKEDMYSFGITMYYTLSGGKYPYDFEKLETCTIDSIYIEDPTFLEEINEIIKRATAFNPNDRYESMEKMLVVLSRTKQKLDNCVNPIATFFESKIACTCDLPASTIPEMKIQSELFKRPYLPDIDCDERKTISAPFENQVEEYGTIINDRTQLEISKVRFSAVAPKKLIKEDYSIIDIVMYEDMFRSVVDDLITTAETPVNETKSGTVIANKCAKIKIQLSSPDIMIDDDYEEQIWQGEYLIFCFIISIPKEYKKRQVPFTATVYIDDVIATRLKFIAKCQSLFQQKITITQCDVLSAFVSYASQDRQRVAMIIQGMKKARPDMHIFFDVESLRSGEFWEDSLLAEINRCDTFFLCWSHNAKESEWVDKEWRYAFETKGAEAIEPIPLEPPSSCPPPEELSKKHFNDSLLYVIKAENENEITS